MTYIEAIGKGFPLVQCHCQGDGSTYESLVLDEGSPQPIPSQETLDAWIAANSTESGVRHVTRLAFRNRFTVQERTLIEYAAWNPAPSSDPNEALANALNAAFLRATLKDLDNASYIDLDRNDTRAGVFAMEAHGLVGIGRATVILDSPVLAVEMPTYPPPATENF